MVSCHLLTWICNDRKGETLLWRIPHELLETTGDVGDKDIKCVLGSGEAPPKEENGIKLPCSSC